MKNTWLRNLFFVGIFVLQIQNSLQDECTFPESEVEPFFFDVRADTQIDSIIVDTVVEPPDAQLYIVNVRSNNIPDVDFTEKFRIAQRSNGQFMILNKDFLLLPDYPSYVNETFLYMTIVCNGKAYPLITVRVKNYNSYTPKFYNLPYQVELPSNAPVNTFVDTPIIALDRDPYWTYDIKFSIVSGQYSDEFALVPSRTESQKLKSLPNHFKINTKWNPEQLPPVVKLHVQRPPRHHEYNLNISATDNGSPPRTTFANLRVIVGESKLDQYLKFTQPEYFANFSKLMTVDTEIIPHMPMTAQLTETAPKYLFRRNRIMYELIDSDYSDYFLLDHRTAQLTVRKRLSNDIPSTFALKIKGFVESEPSVEAITTLSLTDIADRTLTYFSKCFYEIKLQENAYPDTKVIKLLIHGEPDQIELVNGTDYFRIDSLGQIYVSRPLDRERTSVFVFQAKLTDKNRRYLPDARLCQVATITVNVEDVNDHTPRFEKSNYVFYADENPYNNTEIGTLKAFDDDKGEFGKLRYRLLSDDAENLPFMLYQSNGVATLYYVTKFREFHPEKIYSFPVEAYDNHDNPRSARVSVQVIFQPKPDYDVEESTAPHVLAAPNLSLESRESKEKSIDPVPVTVERQEQKPSPKVAHKSYPKSIIRPMSALNNPVHEKFEYDHYKFLLYGQLQEGQYVGTIRIPSQIPNVKYELEPGIRGFFDINPSQGHITIDTRLLEEEYEEVRFTALAKRDNRIVANALVTVILDDSVSIYELTPRFEQSLYRFEIEENEESAVIGTVQAHHRAEEINNDKIIYSLTDTEDAEFFTIDENTGKISNLEEFDREKKHLYKIGIVGCLKSNSSSCGECEAAIVILDTNDNAPKFEETPYKVTISTDIASGTEIVTLKATDADLGRNSQVKYQLISNGNGNFEIDESTGEITYVGLETLNVNRRFNLRARAVDNGTPQMSSETTVVINIGVQNMNPNAPEFKDFRYEVQLPAIVPPNMKIVTVEATDPDEGREGEILYRLREDPDPRQNRILQLFKLDEQTGELWSKQTIHGETDGPLIQLVVEAHDQSFEFPRKAETVVMIRFQEMKSPKLEFVPLPKTVFISNEKQVGSEIIAISAKTASENDQHKVRYSIDQPTDADYFDTPANTGSLRVKNKLVQGRFPITLIAFIPGTPLNASHNMMVVVMTDRDKYPVFEKLGYEMTVPISAAFPVKLDPLNATLSTGHIEYSLYQSERLPKGISVDKMTGQLTIFEEFVSAFDGIGNVFVVIRARNIDWPSFYSDVGVTLVLSDTSTALTFKAKLYRLVITENKQQGTTLEPAIEVQNAAEIGDIHYFVEPNDSLFAINNEGVLYLKKTIDLEELPHNSQGIIDLTVIAVHGDDRATTKVQIKIEDENEFSPVFLEEQYDFEIRHQPEDGEIIGKIRAIDEDFTDRDNVKYEILERSGAASSMVNILPNGSIVKKPGETFRNGIYEMIVQAIDYVGHNTEVVVSFYVQLESTSTPSNQHIDENWDIKDNKVVGNKFAIYGLPNARWQFVIANGNDDGMFELREINETAAEIEVVAEPSKVSSPTRKLAVEIINLDNPQQTMMEKINVDLSQAVANKIPKFIGEAEDKEVKLTPDFNPNAVIITAKAVQQSANDKITYSLTENPDGMFEINPKTGEISFARNNKLKLSGVYQLRVKATAKNPKTNSEYSAEEVYVVEIMPISTLGIPSTEITRIFSEITAEAEKTTTKIVPTQTLPPLPSTVITETTTKTVPSTVTTESTTRTVSSTVPSSTIPPKTELPTPSTTEAPKIVPLLGFESPQYSFMVDNARRGSKIGELQISDAQTLGTSLKFQVEPAEMAKLFRVDEETREIFLVQIPENSEELQEFVFNVTVFDAKDPRRQNQTEVSVTMIPFETPDLPGAPDSDNQNNDEFSRVDSTTKSSFNLNTPASLATLPTSVTESSGRTNSADESAPSAKPISPVSTSPQTLTVEDLKFSTTEFTAMLPEGKYGSTIVKLKPFNLNHNMPPGVRYQIDAFSLQNNETLPFSIREDNGDLIAFGELDREHISSYEFIVTAVSKADPSIVDSALIEVKITDVNDNIPEFVNPQHTAALSSDAPIGTVVANFAVNDPDEGPSGTINFSLEGEYSDYFAISSAGTLIIAKSLENLHDKISLTVVANDGGRPSLRNAHLLEIELYSQSHAKPEFKEPEYNSLLSPDAVRGQFITHVVAGTGNLTYSLDNTFSDLFVVDNNGQVTLGRTPLYSERNKYYTVNLTATDAKGDSSATLLTIFLEAPITTTSPPPTTTNDGLMNCYFEPKIYNASIRENTNGKQKLTQVFAKCRNLPKDAQIVYFIHQGAEEFEINETTGELFVNGPLDRENRTLHFVIVNITILVPEALEGGGSRTLRQSSPIIEYAKSKLDENQALVVVRVIDENDHTPKFTRVNSKGEYVFAVDWQTKPPQPVARIQAVDEDEKPVIKYSMSTSSDYFTLNSTSGVITLVQSLEYVDDIAFNFEITANDGEKEAKTKVSIYPLSPGNNVVVVVVNNPPEEIDELAVSRELTQLLQMDTRILAKQVYMDEQKKVHPDKSHLLIYALKKETHEPLPALELKTMLEQIKPEFETTAHMKMASITVPEVSSKVQMSNWEILILIIALILLISACLTCIFLLKCFKRRAALAKSDAEYMVDAESTGPRPYNVELISRKTAQTMLASRELPNPFEDAKLSQQSNTEPPPLPSTKPPNISITTAST
uniref:Cadherin domain-containing protein n=2 Tax=Panagrolaimus sp. JU765 TaxID=591449 RepID=A0AC34QCU7_9BILA